MPLVSFSFVFVILILNKYDSTLGDIVITIKSEEGVPRKYEFTVQSSQSQEKKPHIDEDISVHKTVYVPPTTSSTTSNPQIYSPKSRPPPVRYKLPPLVKKKRPTYRGKGKKTRHKPRTKLSRSRPKTKLRGKRKPPNRRPNLFENILTRVRG